MGVKILYVSNGCKKTYSCQMGVNKFEVSNECKKFVVVKWV